MRHHGMASASTTSSRVAVLAARRHAAPAGASRRHDPRALPHMNTIRTTVSVQETCSFYGIADALSGCREPRSCQDCLARPGCLLDAPSGRCLDPNQSSVPAMMRDYHNYLQPGQVQYFDPTATMFFAENATYCGVGDRVCDACRHDFDALVRTRQAIGGQFCVGESGCVCVGICEVPQKRVWTTYGSDCAYRAQTTSLALSLPRAPLPLVSSVKRDPRAPHANRFARQPQVTQCEFGDDTLDVKGCKQPRSCLSCLGRPECLLLGKDCAPMYKYRHALDFRVQDPVNTFVSFVQFPSINMSVCPAEHCATCDRALATWRADAYRSTVEMEWHGCLHQSLSCVCAGLCAFMDETRSVSARDNACLDANGGSDWAMPMAMTLFVVLAVSMAVMRYKDAHPTRRARTIERQPRRVMRHMLDELPAVPRLDLFGWRQYQRQLLLKEDELLGGAESVSPVFHHIDYNIVSPSAPDFDDELTSAPVLSDPTALASAPAFQMPEDNEEAVGSLRRRGHRVEEPGTPLSDG